VSAAKPPAKISDKVNAKFPFFWVIPTWAAVTIAYFLAAEIYLWKKTGVNLWKIWWQNDANSLMTERRFAEEIRKFPRWNVGYEFVKWGTPVVLIGYLASIFVFLSQPR
jgi:hypothetical protein